MRLTVSIDASKIANAFRRKVHVALEDRYMPKASAALNLPRTSALAADPAMRAMLADPVENLADADGKTSPVTRRPKGPEGLTKN
ncbi:hypothetical protein [Jiella sp. M17.18]|uniref:hypothetical protein n=1 Tax=Jiella sp. M17.18 TaxID=3234247 RepID=UPI0034E04C37